MWISERPLKCHFREDIVPYMGLIIFLYYHTESIIDFWSSSHGFFKRDGVPPPPPPLASPHENITAYVSFRAVSTSLTPFRFLNILFTQKQQTQILLGNPITANNNTISFQCAVVWFCTTVITKLCVYSTVYIYTSILSNLLQKYFEY